MKKLLLICAAFCCMNTVFAQATACVIIPSYKDSTLGVYPKPYDPITNPSGGIKKIACVGKDYFTDFQVIIPDTFSLSGFQVQLSSASIIGVKGLPKGLVYTCTPADCKFLSKKPGCIRVSGKIDPVVIPGDFDLTIDVNLTTSFGSIPQSFPNPAIANGKYTIKVVKPTDPACISANSDLSDLGVSLQIVPNPATAIASIMIEGSNIGKGKIQIIDAVGRVVRQINSVFENGIDVVNIDTESLQNGIYTVQLSSEKGQLTRKLVVQH